MAWLMGIGSGAANSQRSSLVSYTCTVTTLFRVDGYPPRTYILLSIWVTAVSELGSGSGARVFETLPSTDAGVGVGLGDVVDCVMGV